MDEIEQGQVETINDESILQEEVEVQVEPPKKEYTPEQKLARVERLRAKYMKELGIEEKSEPKPPVQAEQVGSLDKADYAILVAKGIEEKDEIDFVHKQMLKWDMPLTDVLKDEDVQSKLKAMRIEREVKGAMPSSTRRSGGQVDNIDYWIAKYERTGELPEDFELRSAVVNAKYESMSTNKPAWRLR